MVSNIKILETVEIVYVCSSHFLRNHLIARDHVSVFDLTIKSSIPFHNLSIDPHFQGIIKK